MNNHFTSKIPAKHRKFSSLFLGLALLGLVCMAAGAVAVRPDADQEPPVNITNLQEISTTFTQVTKQVAPAVVFVKVEKRAPVGHMLRGDGQGNPLDDELMRKFFGDRLPKFETPQQPSPAVGHGSGFIISEDGHILTNSHVVKDADSVKVTLGDGRELEAKIVGTDARSDVAVIKVDASGLPMLPMGNSDDIQVGEFVLTVGSPFGLSGTVTSGIVSATGRDSVGITDYEDFIQTDAAINPGNSGGPLVNLRGEAIGINTAIFSRSGGYMGIGFAIPINMAHDICDQLIKSGSVTRGYLGVVIQKLTSDLAKSFGIDGTDGVLIGDVSEDSPAAKAGLQAGDVVLRFNGRDAKDTGSFRNRVAQTKPGNKVKIEVVRDGRPLTMAVEVGKLAAKADGDSGNTNRIEHFGLTVQTLSKELAERFGYVEESGVVVTDVQSGSKAALAGIQPGSLIKEVNRQPLHSVEDFKAAINSGANEDVLLLVKKGEYSRYVLLTHED